MPKRLISKFIFALCCLAGTSSQALDFSPYEGEQVSAQTRIYTATGFIDSSDPNKLKSLIADTQGEHVILILNSFGGSNEAGFKMIKQIQAWDKKKKVERKTLAVIADTICASMCVPVFYAFENRFSDPATAFGFHSSSLDGEASRRETLNYIAKFTNMARARHDFNMIRFLKRDLKTVMLSTDLTLFAATELAQSKVLLSEKEIVTVSSLIRTRRN